VSPKAIQYPAMLRIALNARDNVIWRRWVRPNTEAFLALIDVPGFSGGRQTWHEWFATEPATVGPCWHSRLHR